MSMTEEKIRKLSSVNLEVSHEILRQAELRLHDLLAAKESFEHRAGMLLTGQLAIAIGIPTFLANIHASLPDAALAGFGVTSLVMLGAAGCSAALFWSRTYGFMGTEPDTLLHRKLLTAAPKKAQALLAEEIAVIAKYYQGRITISQNSNRLKSRMLHRSICLMVTAPLAGLLTYGLRLLLGS